MRGWEEGGPLLVEMQICAATVKIDMRFLKKLKIELP
jgi:hypothetical protein